MSHPEIIRAFAALHQAGKTPSLALLKAKLGHTVPMPLLIQSLRQFKQDPDSFLQQAAELQPVAEPAAHEKQDISLQLLFDEIRALRSEVAELRALVKSK